MAERYFELGDQISNQALFKTSNHAGGRVRVLGVCVCVLNVATTYEVASVPLHCGARNHRKVPIATLQATVQTCGHHHVHAKASVLIGSHQSLRVLP